AATKLILLNDTVTDFVGTDGGAIQVDGNKDDVGTSADAVLELRNTVINGGGLGKLNVDGQLIVTSGLTSTIENFGGTDFTIDGLLQVDDTAAATKLILLNDTVTDFVGTDGGAIQVDGNKDDVGTSADAVLELRNTVINGGGLRNLNVDGQLIVTSRLTSTIENFGGTDFTIDGLLQVDDTAAATKLILLNDTLPDFVGTAAL